MTQPGGNDSGQSDIPTPPEGLLLAFDSVGAEGEDQGHGEFIVAIEGGYLELRLGDRKNTIWMIELDKAEAALRLLKRWQADRARRRAQ